MNVQIPVKWLQELLALCGPEDHELRERVMVSITAMDEQAAAPVVLPEPNAWAAVYFSGKRAGKIYTTCDTKEQIEAYIHQVHQSDDSITLRAEPIYMRAVPQADARDAAFEAARKKFCKLQRYSFITGTGGCVQRIIDRGGNWVEFDAAHELFDPVAVDAAIAASKESK